jgi:hypothetical protein
MKSPSKRKSKVKMDKGETVPVSPGGDLSSPGSPMKSPSKRKSKVNVDKGEKKSLSKRKSKVEDPPEDPPVASTESTE